MDLEQFYRDNHEKHINIIAKIIGRDVHTAEDVVQDAYAKAFKYKDTYNPKFGKVNTWFNRILFNTLRDYQRKYKQNLKVVNRFIDEVSEEDQLVEFHEAPPSFEECLDDMSNTKHRKIVVLHYILGYTCREVASAEQTTVQNVTTICSRFRARLREKELRCLADC